VNAHENIYIVAGKVFPLSPFPSPPAPRAPPLSAFYPPCWLTSPSALFLFRHSFPVSPLGFPLVPCCSSLFSSTNDGNHPQTHQLTLFQSYRTIPPSSSHSLRPILFSLSPSVCCVSGFTDCAASPSVAESVGVSRVVFALKRKAGYKHPHKRRRSRNDGSVRRRQP